MITAWACAKVNLSLRVGPRRADGLHPLAGRFQSVLWTDHLELHDADTDTLTSGRGGEVVDGWRNLAWRAVELVRDRAAADQPLHVVLTKHVPAAAGLGGGSADAAAALAAAATRFALSVGTVAELAPMLGSDVAFCLAGGAADVTGVGNEVATRTVPGHYALGLVVPPVSLPTATVYRRWDELDGPAGPAVEASDLPPELRAAAPLVNDLYPAAIDLDGSVAEWRAELADRWSRPVLMTGSGPTLFAFFADQEEADAAQSVVPPGARASTSTVPAPFGWVAREDDGPLFGRRGPIDAAWVRRIEARNELDAASAGEGPTIEAPSD